MKKLLVRVLAAGLLWGCVGCATTPTRQALLESTAEHVLYRLPPARVMEAARDIVDERGYLLLPSNTPNYLRTQWKIDGNLDVGARWSRYLVQVHPLPDGQVAVRAYAIKYTTIGRTAAHPGFGAGRKEQRGRKGQETGATDGTYVAGDPMSAAKPTVLRASELEWAILERLNPRFAVRTKAQVDQYLSERTPPPEVTE